MTDPKPDAHMKRPDRWDGTPQPVPQDEMLRRAFAALEEDNAKLKQRMLDLLNKESRTARTAVFIFFLSAAAGLIPQIWDGSIPLFRDGILSAIRNMDPSAKFAVLAGLMAIVSFSVMIIVGYLNRSDRELFESPRRDSMRREIEALKKSMARLQPAKEPAKKESNSAPPSPPEEDAARERLISEVYSKLTEEIVDRAQNSFHLQNIRKLHESSHNRLFREIQKLNERSKLNLSIGIVITMVAAAILFYIAISEPPSKTDVASLAAHYVPRLSTVVFVEVFAFFFFKLYKSGLSDIRAYQQDITRLNQENCAIDLVFFSGDDNARTSIAQALIARKEPIASDDGIKDIDPKLIGELAGIISKIIGKK